MYILIFFPFSFRYIIFIFLWASDFRNNLYMATIPWDFFLFHLSPLPSYISFFNSFSCERNGTGSCTHYHLFIREAGQNPHSHIMRPLLFAPRFNTFCFGFAFPSFRFLGFSHFCFCIHKLLSSNDSHNGKSRTFAGNESKAGDRRTDGK